MKTKEALLSRMASGEKFDYLFFWNEPKNEVVDIACLNQWYHAPFEVYFDRDFGTKEWSEKIVFETAEHAMMYHKAELFLDWEIAQKIQETKSPAEVQRLGREVKGYDDKVWRKVSFDIVVEGNMKKFSQNPELKRYLLSTGDKILVEASPLDQIWGIGLAKEDERTANPSLWRGENKLGFALMEVRRRLLEEDNRVVYLKNLT